MRKVLILTVLATLLFATSALAFDTPVSVETRCFTLEPYCDQVYLDWTMGQQIWGYDDDCGGTPMRVGGWIYSTQDWVLFIDYPGASAGYYEYGLVKGAGLNGTLYRWETNGTPATAVSIHLGGCALAVEGGLSSGELE